MMYQDTTLQSSKCLIFTPQLCLDTVYHRNSNMQVLKNSSIVYLLCSKCALVMSIKPSFTIVFTQNERLWNEKVFDP